MIRLRTCLIDCSPRKLVSSVFCEACFSLLGLVESLSHLNPEENSCYSVSLDAGLSYVILGISQMSH